MATARIRSLFGNTLLWPSWQRSQAIHCGCCILPCHQTARQLSQEQVWFSSSLEMNGTKEHLQINVLLSMWTEPHCVATLCSVVHAADIVICLFPTTKSNLISELFACLHRLMKNKRKCTAVVLEELCVIADIYQWIIWRPLLHGVDCTWTTNFTYWLCTCAVKVSVLVVHASWPAHQFTSLRSSSVYKDIITLNITLKLLLKVLFSTLTVCNFSGNTIDSCGHLDRGLSTLWRQSVFVCFTASFGFMSICWRSDHCMCLSCLLPRWWDSALLDSFPRAKIPRQRKWCKCIFHEESD